MTSSSLLPSSFRPALASLAFAGVLLGSTVAGASPIAAPVPVAAPATVPTPVILAPVASAHGLRVGDARLTVERRLGRPDAILPDGTWVYRQQNAIRVRNGETVRGDLRFHFDGHAVANLTLVRPAEADATVTASPALARRAPTAP